MKPVTFDCPAPKRKMKKGKCDDLVPREYGHEHEDKVICPRDIKTLRKLARKGEL